MKDGSNILESIFSEGGSKFQSSDFHLLFYKKINENLAPDVNPPPELFSMSYCRLSRNSGLELLESAFQLDLLLILQGATAQFVTKDQYLQLLFFRSESY